jgi:hypothetical protein
MKGLWVLRGWMVDLLGVGYVAGWVFLYYVTPEIEAGRLSGRR